MRSKIINVLKIAFISVWLIGCSKEPLNNPYSDESASATCYYSDFSERPKTFDPARSYSSNEATFISQIIEPPLQYHYLKRPFELEPLAAATMPSIEFLDIKGNPVATDSTKVATTVYTITIKPHVMYQPHPALAKDALGNFYYHALTEEQIQGKHRLSDFKETGTRELTAADYVYQIKRLAHPGLHSPILGLMSEYIEGLGDYAKFLAARYEKDSKTQNNGYIDLRQYPLSGVKVLGRYRYQIRIKGQYPQFRYWLAMSFFGPMPWEADRFYSQAGLEDRNISLDWYPIGTGPYQLVENNPNRRIVLVRNPNFHGEQYPSSGMPSDRANHLLNRAGQALPFIDKFIFSLEKESIPRWHKFLQGYYDQSGISADSFDQAIKLDQDGHPHLTPELRHKHIRLQTTVAANSYYLGFNMLDDVVGGHSKRARKLRQAISIVLDYEEYIALFLNGRGVAANGPLPPGIFGHLEGEEGMNSIVYRWQNQRAVRRALKEAQLLMTQAGYSGGLDPNTQQPLQLYLDVASQAGPDDKARFAWMRKQFQKLGIQLQIRDTQYNRFQEKMRAGNAQLFLWGWAADYPDPENFLFLLYGPNGKVKHNGENAANYSNKRFDALFEKMKVLPNGEERQKIINQMVELVRQDAPWIWGFHPLFFRLSHNWLAPTKPNELARNTLKYLSLDASKRKKLRYEWNQPVWGPLMIIGLVLFVSIIPVVIYYWRKEHTAIRKQELSS